MVGRGSTNTKNGSSTVVMELPTYSSSINIDSSSFPSSSARPGSTKEHSTINTRGHTLGSNTASIEGTLPSPTTAVTPILTRWNHPRINAYRLFATFWSFIVLGLNDAAYGALIPYLERYYHVNYTVISLVFLSPIVGYTASALTNNLLHMRYGQRGVAIVMSCSHVVAYVLIAIHPPYPVLVVVFILAGYGNGLGDSGWNAWVGDMANANEVLGFLHACYGLGAAISPLVATALITRAGWAWYEFYYLMIGAAVIEVAVLVSAFWKADGAQFRIDHPHTAEDVSGTATPHEGLVLQEQQQQEQRRPQTTVIPWYNKINPFQKNDHPPRSRSTSKSGSRSRTAEAVKDKVTIISALFLLVYVGIEVSIGGWIVTFMLRVRGAGDFASGLSATGFWLGVTVGRLVLGFVTARLFKTEKHAIATYLVACVGLQLLFWLVPQFIVSAVMVGLLGFFLGPLFPAAVVAMTKLLPKRLHVAGIGFAAAFGASGACVLPFAVGAIANARGVQVLQPIILALLVVDLLVWLFLPKLPKQRTL